MAGNNSNGSVNDMLVSASARVFLLWSAKHKLNTDTRSIDVRR